MPQVTVLMSVYNGEPFLSQAIESILQQTFADFEFIIINDKSTDCSAEVIRSYDDQRIRFFENENNIGLTRSLNYGLSMVRSPYIARMDADDISFPQRLEKQVNYLNAHPNVGVVGTAIQIIDKYGKPSHIWKSMITHEALIWGLCLYAPIAHPTVLMRQKTVEQIGGYKAEMTTAQDYDLWWRLSTVCQLANLPDVLLYLRRHETNITIVHLKEHRQNRVNVSHAAIANFLKRDISIDTVRCIWDQNCNSVYEVQKAVSLIYEIYKTGVNNRFLSLSEKYFMRNYIAQKLLGLAYYQANTGYNWNAVALACWLDPLAIVKASKKRFLRFLN